MKTIILCGGLGSRLSEETKITPKPMVRIGNKPILNHIIDIYKHYGFNKFILALGYKSKFIKNYYYSNKIDSKLELVYTGKNTLTGGRLLRLKKYFNKSETFMLTYGDGLADINLIQLLSFHQKHGGLATMTSVQLASRFGILEIGKNDKVIQFKEKPKGDGNWINAGFFVCEPKVFDYIDSSENVMFEQEPLQNFSYFNRS